jgi:phosphatidylserine/phosphatidylglycerophosphate/cardiolipin synthase-like enzyme
LGDGQVAGLLPHGKLIVIDGKVAVFGGMALSALSLDFRREVSVVVEDEKCLRKLKDFFRAAAT